MTGKFSSFRCSAVDSSIVLGDVAYGVLFGIVSGMMITIVVKELLPTAHRYDVHDKYVTTSFFAGAAVMALSLVLFVI